MLRQITAFMNCIALFFLAQAASAQRCEPGILESPTKSLTLLKAGETESEDPACIEFALRGLQGTKTPEAINILMKYLDFRRPVAPWEGAIRHHLITVSDLYPAIESLYSALSDHLKSGQR